MSDAIKFRKKPVIIEAWRVTDDADDTAELLQWVGEVAHLNLDDDIAIKTLEGTMIARTGDYIIRGVQGEFYPCKPDIFEATYELADDATGEETDQGAGKKRYPLNLEVLSDGQAKFFGPAAPMSFDQVPMDFSMTREEWARIGRPTAIDVELQARTQPATFQEWTP